MASGDVSACMIDRGVAPVALGQQAESRHWVAADERDAFISWLRGEFAAANAIIDALCQHLQIVGSPSEYDFVLACIHQRRYNWNPVLHMQQYYSVAEVLFALQQVALKKQQQQGQVSLGGADEHVKSADFKPNGWGHVNGSAPKQPNKPLTPEKQIHENGESNGLPASVKAEQEQATIGSVTSSIQGQETGVPYANGTCSLADDHGSPVGKETLDTVEESSPEPKYITGLEEIDGKQVNVMEGLEIHEGVFDSQEASRLATLVNDSHAAKKKSKASGGNKRASKAKAKEVIHFGTIPSEILAGQSSPVKFTEETAETMPTFLESIIDRLVSSQIVPGGKRPDSCSISVLEPGDYMPPHRHNNFEQPLFILSLGSQSELIFGRNLKINSTGEADGKYKAVLPAGSVLVLQGNSAQLVQCAVSPLQSTRMLVTFGKMVKRTLKPAAGSPTSPVSNGTSPLSPTFSKQVNGHSFVHVLPTRGGFQSSRTLAQPSAPSPAPMVPPVRSISTTTPVQVLQTQPVIITSVGPYSPVTVVGPAGWSTPPPPAITRVPSPGTGVFLPASGTVVYSNGTHHHHHHQMNGSHRRHGSGASFQNSHSNGVLSEKEVAA